MMGEHDCDDVLKRTLVTAFSTGADTIIIPFVTPVLGQPTAEAAGIGRHAAGNTGLLGVDAIGQVGQYASLNSRFGAVSQIVWLASPLGHEATRTWASRVDVLDEISELLQLPEQVAFGDNLGPS